MKKAFIVMFSMLLLLLCAATAGNVSNTGWRIHNQSSTSVYTYGREKYDNTNVYVLMESGSSKQFMVMKSETKTGNYVEVGVTRATLVVGRKSTLRSSAGTDDWVKLRIDNDHPIPVNAYTEGIWSPDSTQYYTVY